MKPKKEPDKNQVKKYQNYLTSYKTIKTSLKSLIKDESILPKLNDTIQMTNKIVIHTYQFIKLYYLDKYHKKKELPKIDKEFINSVMKILSKEDNRGRKPKEEIVELKLELIKFYDKEYKKLIDTYDILTYTNMNTILDYETVSMLTDYENHISNHFIHFFNRYINVIHKKSATEKKIKENNSLSDKEKKDKLGEFREELKLVKDDLLNQNKKLLSDKKYHKWITEIRPKIFTKEKYAKNSILYDIQCSPLDYLSSLIFMSLEIEKQKEKTFNCFPLRNNITPKYIIVDTTSLIHLFVNKDKHKHNKDFYLTNGNTIKYRTHIWKYFFNTHKKVFKDKDKNYIFNNQIQTDGIGVSINLIRKDLYSDEKKNLVRSVRKPKNYRSIKYIDELTDEEKAKYKNYTKVSVDPGKSTLIYATNGEVKEKTRENGETKHTLNKFKYNQDQRRRETKSKQYMKMLDRDKKDTRIDNKTIKEHEDKLSKFNKKSCKFSDTKKFINEKNNTIKVLFDYYQKDIYRKLKWFGFINRQRTESNMINSFREKYGDNKNIIIGFGDWGETRKGQLKYNEPTKSKGFIKLFQRNKFDIYLIDEYNTSAKSFITGEDTEKFRKRENPRPYKNNIILWHGLLRSKNVPNSKSDAKHSLLCRDINGAMNIWKKMTCILDNQEIPDYLKRNEKNNNSDGLHRRCAKSTSLPSSTLHKVKPKLRKI